MAHLKEELVKRASSTNTVSNSVSHGIRDLDIETEPLNQNVSKEGYLYLVKGTAQGFQHKRTWCVVDNGKLSFQRKNKVSSSSFLTMILRF